MTEYTLYTYFRSSCSARLRIALAAKDIDYNAQYVNLVKGEQVSEQHRALNPSCSVPLLVCGSSDFKIGQSIAALEYLEEAHPNHPLLPPLPDHHRRAVVRTLTNIVACDIQPVTNLKIMKRVREFGYEAESWNKEFMTEGLRAYETVVEGWAGSYSVGDELTMADTCLVPAVWNAVRYGVDIGQFPTVSRIAKNLAEHPAVVKAHWKNQPDTPEEFRQ